MDNTLDRIPIADFVNKELILFSMADKARSIPNAVDGLKRVRVLLPQYAAGLLQGLAVVRLGLIELALGQEQEAHVVDGSQRA